MCTSPGSAAHSKMRGKHEKYNVKVGKVLNLMIYIYKKAGRGRGLCIKVDWGGSEHGKPSNPGRSGNTMQ